MPIDEWLFEATALCSRRRGVGVEEGVRGEGERSMET